MSARERAQESAYQSVKEAVGLFPNNRMCVAELLDCDTHTAFIDIPVSGASYSDLEDIAYDHKGWEAIAEANGLNEEIDCFKIRVQFVEAVDKFNRQTYCNTKNNNEPWFSAKSLMIIGFFFVVAGMVYDSRSVLTLIGAN